MNIFIKGLGSIGQRHIRNLKKNFPKAKLYVLKSNRKRYAINHKFKLLKTTVEKKYKLITLKSLDDLKYIKIDCAFICSPSSKHIDDAMYFIKKGIYVFIEKPIDSDPLKVNRLINKYKFNKKIMIGFQMKFNPLIKHLKKVFESNKYGLPKYVHIENHESIENIHPYEDYRKSYTSRKELGGGVVLGFIHELDYFLYLFDNYKIIKSKSITSKISNLKIDVEDISNSIFFLKNKLSNKKLICSISLNYFQTPKKRKISITFDKGLVELDLITNTINTYQNKKIYQKNFKFNINDTFENEVKYFIKSVKNNSPIDYKFSINNASKSFEIVNLIKSNFTK